MSRQSPLFFLFIFFMQLSDVTAGPTRANGNIWIFKAASTVIAKNSLKAKIAKMIEKS